MVSSRILVTTLTGIQEFDYALLKKHNEGVIAASACLGGVYASDFKQNREEGEDAVLDAMRNNNTEDASNLWRPLVWRTSMEQCSRAA